MRTRNTKELRAQYQKYLLSNIVTLHDAYNKYSNKKELAYNDCINLMNSLNGENFTIISYNAWMFTCGFIYKNNDKLYFVYISPTKTEQLLIKED